MPARPYQDVVSGGRVVAKGYRDCADRFDVVASLLPTLPPNPTVLDFGANAGYFAYRLAEEFGATVTAVDDAPALRKRRAHANVKRIGVRLTPEAVADLPRFDLVLGLSVLHHNERWRDLLTALLGRARLLSIVETPHPEEPLRQAVARAERPEMIDALSALGDVVGTAKGVRSDHQRPIYAIGSVLRGRIFHGNGNCGRFWKPILGKLEPTLGFRPFPGSLNLEVETPIPGDLRLYLGNERAHFWDDRRAKGGKRGGDYQFWPARIGTGSHSVDGFAMIPGVRSHAGRVLELVAPIGLREAWGLAENAPLWVRLR